jgi:hypothetical protein
MPDQAMNRVRQGGMFAIVPQAGVSRAAAAAPLAPRPSTPRRARQARRTGLCVEEDVRRGTDGCARMRGPPRRPVASATRGAPDPRGEVKVKRRVTVGAGQSNVAWKSEQMRHLDLPGRPYPGDLSGVLLGGAPRSSRNGCWWVATTRTEGRLERAETLNGHFAQLFVAEHDANRRRPPITFLFPRLDWRDLRGSDAFARGPSHQGAPTLKALSQAVVGWLTSRRTTKKCRDGGGGWEGGADDRRTSPHAHNRKRGLACVLSHHVFPLAASSGKCGMPLWNTSSSPVVLSSRHSPHLHPSERGQWIRK